MMLAFTELGVLGVAQFGKAGFYYLLRRCLQNKGRWKPNLQLSDFALWLLYNQCVHWIVLLWCPWFIVMSGTINLIAFYLLYFIINNFYERENSANANDISDFIMLLLNFTFLIVQIIYGFWFLDVQDSRCGPITYGTSGWNYVKDQILSADVTNVLYNFFTFEPFLLNLIGIVYVRSISNSKHTQAVQAYLAN